MKEEYDFSKARRGAILKSKGKTRITIYLDDDVIEAFRSRAEKEGCGYQTLINRVLRAALMGPQDGIDAKTLRRILREELGRQK